MAVATEPSSLVEQLCRVEGKAEIVGGRVVPLMPTGRMPAHAAFMIAIALHFFIRQRGLPGIVMPDNAGFIVRLPNRHSFSPDAAYYEGPDSGMRFFEGPPLFAVEVRSEGDYGPTAEREIAEKRRDYFAAGTLTVWDVDLLSDEVVRKYEAAAPNAPNIYRRGETADAGAAVPSWTMPVEDLFE